MLVSNVIDANRPVVILTCILIVIGFLFGLRPQFYEPILKEVQETTSVESFRDIPQLTFNIFSNNAQIAVYSTVGGVVLLPTIYLAIFGVGTVFGAVAATTSIETFILVLLTFGLLELYALFLAVTAGLLFPKYALSKVLGHSETFGETLKTAGTLLGCSIMILLPSALAEAVFLYSVAFNPEILVSSLLFGLFVTSGVLYVTLRR